MFVVVLALVALAPAASAGNANGNFTASLEGGNEVPAVDTMAKGQAIIKVHQNDDGIGFKLIVANIEDVVAAHIHCAAEGVSGPVGVTLFTGDPDGRVDGILAQGSFEAPDDGNACGWEDNEDVVAAIEGGDTYVNVHTTDVGSGEIRGQVG